MGRNVLEEPDGTKIQTSLNRTVPLAKLEKETLKMGDNETKEQKTSKRNGVLEVGTSEWLVAGLRNILDRNYALSEGSCPWCEELDYPVDKEGKRIEGPNVEDAEQWQLEHADDCPVTYIEKLLKGEYKFIHEERH